MPNQPTKEMFLNDVKNHSLSVLKDDGIYRHISLSNNNNFNNFDIVTWPNHLLINGDMGNFVFTRVVDMFNFFRNDKLSINESYWAEKVIAEDKNTKVEKFSAECFIDEVYNHVIYSLNNSSKLEKYLEGKGDDFEWNRDNIPNEILSEIYDLLDCQDEYQCIETMRNFNSELINFQDFWDHNFNEYSYHYIWCCYAIVWAIQQYDLSKISE